MMALVTGGASSGKSAVAERLALTLPGPRAYVATMSHGDAETEARIARHRAQREGKGFATVELAVATGGMTATGGTPAGLFRTVLVEDLGNAVANGLEDALEPYMSCENVVVVANETGCDGRSYDAFTTDYIERLGAYARKLAARASVVVEVTCGVPVVLKGRDELRERSARGEAPWAC